MNKTLAANIAAAAVRLEQETAEGIEALAAKMNERKVRVKK